MVTRKCCSRLVISVSHKEFSIVDSDCMTLTQYNSSNLHREDRKPEVVFHVGLQCFPRCFSRESTNMSRTQHDSTVFNHGGHQPEVVFKRRFGRGFSMNSDCQRFTQSNLTHFHVGQSKPEVTFVSASWGFTHDFSMSSSRLRLRWWNWTVSHKAHRKTWDISLWMWMLRACHNQES